MRAKIKSIKAGKQGGGSLRLYNIAVEGDESYVVEGLVSHNCRCTTITYAEEESAAIADALPLEEDDSEKSFKSGPQTRQYTRISIR